MAAARDLIANERAGIVTALVGVVRAGFALRIFALGLFIVLALVSFLMTGPLVHGDEGSYLLNAAAIAGKLKSSLSAGYYSGYSVLIVPGFLLFSDFASIFHYALLVNAVLIASLPFALRRVLQCVVPDAGPGWHALGAAAASCQVAVLANAQLALSENLLTPLYAWVLAFGAAMLLRRRRSDAAICGALAGALFLAHPRGAVMALPILLALSLACLRERDLRLPTLYLWICALLVGALHVPLEWLAEKSSGAQVDSYSLRFMLGRFATPAAWGQALFTMFGAFTYIAVATFGLVVLALRETIAQTLAAWRQRGAQLSPAATVSLAMLLGLAASILITAVYLNPPTRADHIIYGRYTLPTFVPLLALGLTGLRMAGHGRPPRAWWAIATTLACIVLIGLAFHLLPHPPSDSWVHVNILDLYIPFMLAGRIDWPTIGCYFGLVAFAIYLAASWSGKIAALLFAAFSATVATYITIDSTLPGNALRGRERQSEHAVREFEKATGTPLCVSIASTLDNWHAIDYQNWLFDRIDESTVVDRTRCVRAIIASMTDKKRPSSPRFRLISTDLNNPYGLFIQASPALDAFAASHPLPPADFPAPLPENERSAKLELLDISDGTRLRAGRTYTFGARIMHAGGTVTWPALFDASPLLAVRAGARVDPLDGGDPHIEFRADLPRSLAPGESTKVTMTIGPFTKAGRYALNIGALQEGIAWFDETQTITIAVF